MKTATQEPHRMLDYEIVGVEQLKEVTIQAFDRTLVATKNNLTK